MSAAPIETLVNRPTPVVNPPIARSRNLGDAPVAPVPTRKPTPAPQPVRRTRAPERQTDWTTRLVVFGIVFVGTYVVSAVSGQVLLAAAHREEIRARSRAARAQQREGELRAELDELTSTAAIQEWAQNHGFIAPDAQVPSHKVPRVRTPEQTLVAQR